MSRGTKNPKRNSFSHGSASSQQENSDGSGMRSSSNFQSVPASSQLNQVTDAREAPQPKNQQRPHPLSRAGTRIISVDNVLQYASEIPSAQRRLPPGGRPAVHTRTPSGRHPFEPKLTGRGISMAGKHMPSRTSKLTEKLVLLPETAGSPPDDRTELGEEDEAAPPSDAELIKRRHPQIGDKSYAERLPKARRTEKFGRVTAYCTAQSTRLRATAEFTRDQHGARTKLYDDCLYCVYQLPLLGGSDGYRIRSSPVLKNPGGKSVLDEQIEANERRDYREGWQEEHDEYSVRGSEREASADREMRLHEQMLDDQGENRRRMRVDEVDDDDDRRRSTGSMDFLSSRAPIASDAMTVGELYIFSYGVVVFWNFSEHQEKDILADLTFSSTNNTTSASSKNSQKPGYYAMSKPSLLTRPLSEEDFETEEFHFEYNRAVEKPRIFNDMITLRTSDHMIKLAMSHAIAQSTKLSFFEERMSQTMNEAQYVPRKLALEGRLGMTRAEVVALVGKLFEGRVDVNLCKSNHAQQETSY